MDLMDFFPKRDNKGNSEVKEFEVFGKKFGYVLTTAGQAKSRLKELMYRDDDGKLKEDFAKQNEFRLLNIVSVPHNKSQLKEIMGVEKDWSELTDEQKIKYFDSMKEGICDKVMRNINRIEIEGSEEKKNSLKQSKPANQDSISV